MHTIGPVLSRRRGCCEWHVIDKDGGLPTNTTDGYKYFEMVCAYDYSFQVLCIHRFDLNIFYCIYNIQRVRTQVFATH